MLDLIEEFVDEERLRMVQDVCTRWNSTFLMLQRFLKLKRTIVSFLSSSEMSGNREDGNKCSRWITALHSRDILQGWKGMEELILLLQEPFFDTKKISSRRFLVSEVCNMYIMYMWCLLAR